MAAVGGEDSAGRGRRGWRGAGREHLSGRETGRRRRRLGEMFSLLRPVSLLSPCSSYFVTSSYLIHGNNT